MTHVAVIGSGVVGAAIAYELSRIDGFSITLIDKNYPASGATGAALGIMMGIIRCDSFRSKLGLNSR